MAQAARAVEDMLFDDSASALEDRERDSSSPDPSIDTPDTPVPPDEPDLDPDDAFVPVSDALISLLRGC